MRDRTDQPRLPRLSELERSFRIDVGKNTDGTEALTLTYMGGPATAFGLEEVVLYSDEEWTCTNLASGQKRTLYKMLSVLADDMLTTIVKGEEE